MMFFGVNLTLYPHRAIRLTTVGIEPSTLIWNARPMLCPLNYAVSSLPIFDISELSLSMLSMILKELD